MININKKLFSIIKHKSLLPSHVVKIVTKVMVWAQFSLSWIIKMVKNSNTISNIRLLWKLDCSNMPHEHLRSHTFYQSMLYFLWRHKKKYCKLCIRRKKEHFYNWKENRKHKVIFILISCICHSKIFTNYKCTLKLNITETIQI